MTDTPITPAPEQEPSIDENWLSTERLSEIIDIAERLDAADDEPAADAINVLMAENILLRNQTVVSTGAFNVMARTLDAVIYAAERMGQKKIVELIEHLLRAEGLLSAEDKLTKQDSGLIIPDTKTTKKITHKGRITEVS
jgi:hypothetical protein